jgi:PncC family amidohydrolase
MTAVTNRLTQRDLERRARELARLLRARSLRIVFAESCTGGLVSAVLAAIPGISEHYCGSAVVYRIETKSEWLGISRELLDDPGPVSGAAAEAMALGVLARTPEADLSVSVTGHLGPNAPEGFDGLVFISAADRSADGQPRVLSAHEFRLDGADGPLGPRRGSLRALRQARQRRAAALVLDVARSAAGGPDVVD